MGLHRAAGVGLALLLTSCSLTRPVELWTNDALEVRAVEDRGALDEAQSRYAELLKSPPNDDKRRWVEFRQAEILRAQARTDEAEERYKRLWSEPFIDEWGAKAMLHDARMQEQLGRPHDALSLRLQTILRYPNEVSAENALRDIYDQFEPTPRTLNDLLENLAPQLSDSYLAGNVLYLQAQNLDQNLGDIDAAAAIYRRIYVEFPEDALADDALWEMTNIYRRVQAWPAAVQNLKVIANNTESSWFIGSYDSQWVDDAIFDLGVIHLLFLSDYDNAVAWFERFATTYDDSLRAPEALYYAAEARRLQHQDDRHFAILRRIVKSYPESKWARRASDRLGTWGRQ
ncbi:MAG: tetratricopeptide repeat protein [bacterium]